MKEKKSKGILKAILIVFAIIIIVLICILIWQRKNITAVYDGLNKSDEAIQQEIQNSKKTVEEELEAYNVEGLRDFTIEEEEAIRKGQITAEEAVAKIIEESNVQNGANTQNNSASNSTSTSSTISQYTVELYTLKAKYLGEIGNLIDEAKADYKNGTKAKELMSKYLGRAGSLEGEADSKVESLLSELKGKLEAEGADTSIIETMRKSYENEKSLKKSYYLSLFNKKK